MKQLLQDLAKGHTTIVEAPFPQASSQSIVINSTLSLISVGTERMLVDFGKANLVQKAMQQPEKVKVVLEKIKIDGLVSTLDSVRSKLKQLIPLGYSNVGIVTEVGSGVSNFAAGDRVVSNGHHADMVKVSKNLCAKIPDAVDNESAVFTVLASIALQGIRLTQPTLGESIAVTGVGLIGLLAVQLLRAQGCRVLAIDFDSDKLELARQFGAEICNPGKGEDPVSVGMAFSGGKGIDGVIITASTKSSDPVTQAARMSRQRGRIILVGVTGLELNRADFYKKELAFQVSCSYGPGRYDASYEDEGNDYPVAYVRWTEQRNFEAVLNLMSEGKLNVSSLISHRFLFEDAFKAYEVLSDDKSALGILLRYTSDHAQREVKSVALSTTVGYTTEKPVLGFIGAGNYASRLLIPAFKKAGGQLHSIVSSGGVSGVIHGEKAGFAEASTDVSAMLSNDLVNCIVIATRHDSHAELVIEALNAGKHIFVEKPLCLTLEDLAKVEAAYGAGENFLMVGFNRRFSPHVKKIKSLLDGATGPKSFVMTVNAGEIPADHWVQNTAIGGGRIIGEACHFIDLLRFLAGTSIKKASIVSMDSIHNDTASISLQFADGSIGTIHYFANGSKTFPKERLEVFVDGRILQLDNFRKLTAFGWPEFKKMNNWQQDKGQDNCCLAFLEAIEEGEGSPIPFEEILEVSRLSVELANN